MIRLANFPMDLDYTEDSLRKAVCLKLRMKEEDLLSLKIYRRSVDARDKNDVRFVLSVDLTARNEAALLRRYSFLTPVHPAPLPPLPASRFSRPPVVVGAGPAGLFCALTLARAGANPILIERGKKVEDRALDVNRMADHGILDPESNVQFGEGGAGAFSDGKLTCGIKSPFLHDVLETFVSHGAPEEILIDPKPHIGTDRLKGVVAAIRNEIIDLGGDVRFETRLDGLILHGAQVRGIKVTSPDGQNEIRTDTVLLCIGHSARDTIRNLFESGVSVIQKPFAIGVRIEHPRRMIDRAQYGSFASHPRLGAASYKLNCHTPDGRGVYTFCMCPGGHVIAAASQPGGVVVNGMSYHARDAENSNSALLVGVRVEDFGDNHPLAGFVLQRGIERAAFRAANPDGSGFRAPAQRLEDFLANRPGTGFGEVQPSYRPGVTPVNLRDVLPDFISANLALALPVLDRQLHGFAMPDAVLTGPETRSSSPVRLPRNASFLADGLSGLYPVGEGAGYAGGIVSAAVDGIGAARAALSGAF